MILRSFHTDAHTHKKNHDCLLTITEVKPGHGTTGNQLSYRYRFSLPPIAINSDDILTVAVADPEGSSKRYVIHSYASTSPGIAIPRGIQLPFPAEKHITSIDFDLKLRPNELALLSIIVIDTFKTPTEPYDLICCDPQVGNDAKT